MSICRRVAMTALLLSTSTIVACRPAQSDAGEPEAAAPTPTPTTTAAPTPTTRRPAKPKPVEVAVDESTRAKASITRFYDLLRTRQVRLARGMLLEPSDTRRIEALAAHLGWTAELMESGRLRIDVLDVRTQGKWAVVATRVKNGPNEREREEFMYLQDGEWRVAPEAVRSDPAVKPLIDDDFKTLFNWYRNERTANAGATTPVATNTTPTGNTGTTSRTDASGDTSSVPLSRRDALGGAVSLLVPDAFTVMTPEMLRTKYPGNDRPTLVFTNETGSINVALNHTSSRVSSGELPMIKGAMDQQFKRLDPAPMDYESTVTTIGDSPAIRFNFRSEAVDTDIHNLMAALVVDGRLLLTSVNLTVENEKTWLPVANRIIESIRID